MKKRHKSMKWLIILVVLIICIVPFSIWQNNSIVITQTDFVNDKIPDAFDQYKIVQISDLHNKLFGANQEKLLNKVRIEKPDIIVVTGDLVDQRKYNLEKSMLFIKGAVKIAPVYYVSGNHEAWSGNYETIKKSLIDAGVIVLDNAEFVISRGDATIKLLGVSDPDFLTSSYLEGTNTTILDETFNLWSEGDAKDFKILLSHRPELFDLYSAAKMDLVFSGHAHGGQIRLPFVGGLVAPDQGFFPKYASGSFTEGSTTMFVSRGLGNSIVPQRLFNRPEIVVVMLKSK